jgi:hypothetical protein
MANFDTKRTRVDDEAIVGSLEVFLEGSCQSWIMRRNRDTDSNSHLLSITSIEFLFPYSSNKVFDCFRPSSLVTCEVYVYFEAPDELSKFVEIWIVQPR